MVQASDIIPLNTGTGRNIVAVEIPDGAYDITINNNVGMMEGLKPTGCIMWCRDLPKGNTYTLLFTTSTATEEDARGVVESIDSGAHYRDYILFRGHLENVFDTALESLTSLLKSHGLEGNWAIIEVK